MTMVRDATKRRIERKYARTDPDLRGFLPTDGVTFGIVLEKDNSEDLLGLDTGDDSLRRALAGELGTDHTDAHDRRQHGQEDQEPGHGAV